MSTARDSIIGVGLKWWLGELRSLLPSLDGGESATRSHRLVLDVAGERVAITECHGARSEPLGDYPLHADEAGVPLGLQPLLRRVRREQLEVVLRIPDQLALSKLVTLPRAARENLREVLGYQMDQETPFRADEVYYDYQITGTETKDGRLEVRLVLVPKAQIEPVIKPLSDWGLSPSLIVVADDESAGAPCSPAPLTVWSAGGGDLRSRHVSRTNRVLGVLVVLLALVALVLPLGWQWSRIAALDREIAEVTGDARAAQALLHDIDSMRLEGDALLRQRQQTPVAVQVLNELSSVVPDDTFLERLELKEGQLSIQGLSEDAAALIGLLEASPLFSDATFRSPVTRDPRSGRYRFQVVVSVRSGGQP